MHMSPEELTDGARVRRRFETSVTGVIVGWRVNGEAKGYTTGHLGGVGDQGEDRVVVRLEPPIPNAQGGQDLMYGSPLATWELCPPG